MGSKNIFFFLNEREISTSISTAEENEDAPVALSAEVEEAVDAAAAAAVVVGVAAELLAVVGVEVMTPAEELAAAAAAAFATLAATAE